MSGNLDPEKIRMIDTSVDEEFKTTMFGFWRTKRKSEGKPLTEEEISFYQSKRNSFDWENMLTVILPMSVFLTLKKSIDMGSAITISLLIGIFIKIALSFIRRIRKNEKSA